MDQNNLIKNHAFSKNEISLVDSFVLNKLGEGHGESTLYLGGKKKHEQIYELFGNSPSAKIKLFFSKENFISILNFYEPYFKKPHGFYLNNGKLVTFKDGLYDIPIQKTVLHKDQYWSPRSTGFQYKKKLHKKKNITFLPSITKISSSSQKRFKKMLILK